ncbi:MAG: AbrB family transcriptional regulator [Nostocales cyanobacterium]|nr:MAG: AbrB family transcriptional regulator [Nostocales cyanobacterium]
MEITRLSPQGEVIIPQSLREVHHWDAGQEFIIIDMGNGILLQPKNPFPVTKLEDVAGCLKYDGEPATLEDMEDAIRQGVEEILF